MNKDSQLYLNSFPSGIRLPQGKLHMSKIKFLCMQIMQQDTILRNMLKTHKPIPHCAAHVVILK